MNPDKLDRLFSDFFHSEMTKRPWPPAPLSSEVASVVARNSTPDPNRHARRVLTVSVAILLGGCWALSNGLPATDRGPAINAPAGTNMLPGASAEDKGVLPEIRKGKAKTEVPAFVPGPMNLP